MAAAKGETLTRKQLIEQLRRELGSNAAAKQLLDGYFDEVTEALIKSGVVKLHNFGRFETSAKRRRDGRNPRNGKATEIKARTVVKFRPCSKLRGLVRNPTRRPGEDEA